MEYISPEEDAVFKKALRLLWERRLAMEGYQAEITPHLVKEPEE